MNNLTAFQRDLLYVIAGFNRPSGKIIGSKIEKYTDSEISYGWIYENLDLLTDEGLVEKGELDGRTNYYSITNAGRNAIRERRIWEEQYFDDCSRVGDC